MALFDSIEKLGRAIFESSFSAAKDAPELTEIRLAVLDAVKSRSHRAGAVRVLSHDLIRVHLRGVPEAQASAFEGGFLAEYLARDVRSALARSSFRFPENLRVEVHTIPGLPGPGEGWVAVETEMDAASSAQEPAHPQRTARLVVLQGTANKPELALNKTRTNIGRTVDVFHDDGPARRNDLAFVQDSEINRTVSREHAHIVAHKKSSEYRIFNDRWYKGANCGLWILREGLSQPVHRGDHGLVLQAGDEIHAGRAVIKFVAR
jgi:pSer/pThr/pTyr-binding forkhead associated (FHA) protein